MLQRTRQTAIVVDDDAMIRAILRSALGSLGLDVQLACHGYEAVSLASRVNAMLILLDLAMPGLDGVSACAQIRALPGYAQVPIVVLTATLNPLAETIALEAGVTMVLHKPFQPATLLQKLAGYCNISRTARSALAQSAIQARSIASPPPPSIDQRIWR